MARVYGMAVSGMAELVTWLVIFSVTFSPSFDLLELLYLGAHACILVPIPLGYGCSLSLPFFCSLSYGTCWRVVVSILFAPYLSCISLCLFS